MSLDFDVEDEVRETLTLEIGAGRSHDELFRLVRKRHPQASKRQIVHAAFRSVIDAAYRYDDSRALLLQKFGFKVRILD
jgi:hypothetical protein